MYPHERSLVKKYQGRPFAIVGVNSDRDRESIRRIVAEKDLTWRSFWCGPDGTRGEIPTRWNVQGWPTVYVIDHEGVIRHKSHGDPGLDEIIARYVVAAEKAGERETGGNE